MLRIAGLLVAMMVNGGDNKEATDRLVPESWKGNPWGPAAAKARANGQLPPIVLTPSMKRWDRWGKAVLKEGDIVFRRGDARVLFGYFPFSRFIANVSGSPFSHTGIIAVEKGEPVVYDVTKAGIRRQPFCVWVLDNTGPFGVKRLRADWRSKIPTIIRFCRETYEKQVPFDYVLGLDDSALYCIEMTEKAFRSAGLKLSEPVRLGEMERVSEFPICMFAFRHLSPLRIDQKVFFPGNDRHGIWSSHYLETIHPPDRVGAARPSGRSPTARGSARS
ncbi:MAG TPA: YiiX/YebB-like N1pC/P60 family cysteine hydrolase [Isosphaeraceae bacterium]|nr:YiiX/YebB-like N1pC/P60 family cysteine hydrolase [Isosphaeraceae bacterium]